MIKVNNGLLQATKAKYQAEILECIATLEIYFTNAVDKYVGKLESASGKLNALGEHFTSKTESQLLQEQQGYSVHNGTDANSESESE